jgi:hypothetical protein
MRVIRNNKIFVARVYFSDLYKIEVLSYIDLNLETKLDIELTWGLSLELNNDLCDEINLLLNK